MPTIVRRLEQGRIEVIFERPVPEASDRGAGLLKLADHPDTHLERGEGAIRSVVAREKEYLNHLRDVNASKDEIRNVRAALDDSKKARRERMRG